MPGLVILGVIIVVLLVIPIGIYHSPVGKRNQVHNIFGTMGFKLKTLFEIETDERENPNVSGWLSRIKP